MRRIVFVNRYFYPDHSATSQLLSDLALVLTSQGVKVEVITSRQLYDQPDAEMAACEVIRGVQVRRVWTSRFGRRHLFGRAVDYVTFYLSAFTRMLLELRPGDVVVAKTDPPLISVVAALASRLRRADLVNWVQDLFPEVATALGVRFPVLLERSVRGARNWSLRAARCNVVLGKRMAKTLMANGIPESQIAIIHNWSNEDDIAPFPVEGNPLRRLWGLEGKFVVGYSGNMGRAHEFDTILDAAHSLLGDERIAFLFIGDGALRSHVEEQAKARGLMNISFKPYQPREKLSHSLGVPDIHLISLRAELEGLIVPSKFYGIAAAGRPTIFIGDPEGEIPGLLRDGDCGEVVKIGLSGRLGEIIQARAGQCDKTKKMGMRARGLFEDRFTARRAFDKWVDVLGLRAQACPPHLRYKECVDRRPGD